MKRRQFIAGLGGAAVWPAMSHAQQQSGGFRRVGVLMGGYAAGLQLRMFTAFRSGLDKLGWKPERNIGLEVRWGEGSAERIRQAAAELLA
jgi:putative tryptophan/tyrosine transport system substrate-binding protein